MRKLGVTLSTVLIVTTAPPLVAAADLFTPLLVLRDTNDDVITCTALNVSSQTRLVTVRVLTALASEVTDVTAGLHPGEGTAASSSSSGGTVFRYCQFTVDGSKKAIRAGAIMQPGNTFHPRSNVSTDRQPRRPAMFHRSLLALALTLLIASSAHAATIFITPALAPPDDGALWCSVVNGSTTQTIEFVRQIIAFDGTVLFNPNGESFSLGPLETAVVGSPNNSARYCFVTLVHGSKTKV